MSFLFVTFIPRNDSISPSSVKSKIVCNFVMTLVMVDSFGAKNNVSSTYIMHIIVLHKNKHGSELLCLNPMDINAAVKH